MNGDGLQTAQWQHCSIRGKRAVSELISAWPSSVPFDAQSILAEHSELQGNHSAVLDLAYEEFCRRVQQGESIAAEAFVRRFPEVERSLLHLLQVHRRLEQHSEIAAALTADQWPNTGEVFLDFELLEEIGRGAFSRVFLGADQILGNRRVVVKVCQRGGEEAQVLGRLQHPGIVPVHSAHRDDPTGLWLIRMPDLGRATLFSVLDTIYSSGKPPLRASVLLDAAARVNGVAAGASVPRLLRRGTFVDGVLLIGLQLAEALALAHSQGICHGDLKPSNILLTTAGQAMLLDFNLSFANDTAAAGPIGGTLPYMAPEQLRRVISLDEHSAGDARTDLFGLAVVLYELLTGELPFGAIHSDRSLQPTAAELLERQQHGPRPLRQQNPRVSHRVARLIESCLAYQPADRPHSATELVRQLKAELSVTRQASRWVQAHPARAIAVAALALASISGLGSSLVAYVAVDRREREPKLVQYQMETLGQQARQLAEAARRAIRDGDLETAVRQLDRALLLAPDLLDARFWRGRARLILGQRQLAREDLRSVLDQTQDARVAAYLAYGYALDNGNVDAIRLNREAIDRGFAPVAVWNNLGHCHLMRNQLDEAEKCLLVALEFDRPVPAASHNLGLVYLQRAFGAQGQQRLATAHQAAMYLERALDVGRESAELYLDLGRVYSFIAGESLASRADESATYTRRALQIAERAVRLGIDPKRLQVVWESLPRSAEVNKTTERLSDAPAPAEPLPTTLLVDPVVGLESEIGFGALTDIPGQ